MNTSVSAKNKGLVLQQVDYRVRLMDLLSEIEVRQVYQNSQETNIEAVFTFPMPIRATLLDLEVEMGARHLKGLVVERNQGQETYEDAVVDGDAAILLEQVEEGLYTLNAGNLLPGETACISYRYAELFSWREDEFRFFLPTTVAPRYGDPAGAGLAPHQMPDADLIAENVCRIEIEAQGPLARAHFASPTHRIEIEPGQELTRIRLADPTMSMDRDFVLNVTSAQQEKTFALREEEEAGCMLWASFCPLWEAKEDDRPRSIKIVVDCSGSMAGDPIAQARRALGQILDLLRPQDYFNLILFGDNAYPLFEHQMLANIPNISKAHAVLETVNATMGGTEIGQALQAAYTSPAPEEMASDVLLITDGEVWAIDSILEEAIHAGHRIFTIGVGSAVSERLVRILAEKTAGACELVAPNEEMAARIVRHFRRIYAPVVRTAEIDWPAAGVAQIPTRIGPLYRGETLHVFARCKQVVDEQIRLDLTFDDGTSISFCSNVRAAPWQSASISMLSRLAVAQKLREEEVDQQEAIVLAVRYQLVTSHTAMLVVVKRAEGEKSEALPELRQVPNMLAAGWGGAGMVVKESDTSSYPLFQRKPKPPRESDEVLFMRRALTETEIDLSIDRQITFTHKLYLQLARDAFFTRLKELADLGLEEGRIEWLRDYIDEEHSEEDVVAVFVFLVAKNRSAYARDQERRLRQKYRQIVRSGDWDDIVEEIGHWTDRY